jgi:hypothetical protein
VCPAARNEVVKCRPTKPVAPQIRIFMLFLQK